MKHTAERLKGPIFGNVNPLFLYRSKMFKWDILMFSSVWILKYFYTNILFFFMHLVSINASQLSSIQSAFEVETIQSAGVPVSQSGLSTVKRLRVWIHVKKLQENIVVVYCSYHEL